VTATNPLVAPRSVGERVAADGAVADAHGGQRIRSVAIHTRLSCGSYTMLSLVLAHGA